VRTIERRRAREKEAGDMNDSSSAEGGWEHIAPELDAALGELNEADRDAVLLRYFERKSAREIAERLGISDEAAQKRVSRAVERLRELFAKRGIPVGASGLAVVMSANAVHAAPAGLAATISAAALAGAVVSTAAVVAATSKTMAMTTFQKTLVAATVALLAGVGIHEARQNKELRERVQKLQQRQVPLVEQLEELQRGRDESASQLAALREDYDRLNRNALELLKLRGEVGVLRRTTEALRDENSQLQNQVQSNSAPAESTVKASRIAEVILTRLKPRTVEEELIRREISVKAGDIFDRTALDADVRKLYATGWFYNIRVIEKKSSEGITLNYALQEKPKVIEVRFSGNTSFDEKSLNSLLSSKPGQLFDDRSLYDDVQRIQAFYNQTGYPSAKVKSTFNMNEDLGEVAVEFKIIE
jgi:outer membrane translocation and assembly module TamA